MNKCNKCYHNKVCLDSANYKNAEKCSQFKDKSLIVELLCRIGDNVYMTTRNNILEMQVVQIKLSKHSIVFDCVNTTYDEYEDFFYAREVGKSVFLTREEAEQALKERENNA